MYATNFLYDFVSLFKQETRNDFLSFCFRNFWLCFAAGSTVLGATLYNLDIVFFLLVHIRENNALLLSTLMSVR